MSRLVFLVEEKSMKVFLEGLLPRVFPNLDFLCVTHEGKKDLLNSVPRKLLRWPQADSRFMILVDNDRGNCQALKTRLLQICRDSGRPDTSIRIVCQELEAWYLGDLDAVAKAFSNDRIRKMKSKVKFRNPDSIPIPSRVMKDLVPEFQKVSGARKISLAMDFRCNCSKSFHVFWKTLERFSRAGIETN